MNASLLHILIVPNFQNKLYMIKPLAYKINNVAFHDGTDIATICIEILQHLARHYPEGIRG